MECFCEKKSYELKVEGDMGADPIWCNRCGYNLDIVDIPISNELKRQLLEWQNIYGEWIDWDNEKLLPNGIEKEKEHNKRGVSLTDKIKSELVGEYKITFSASTMTGNYAGEK